MLLFSGRSMIMLSFKIRNVFSKVALVLGVIVVVALVYCDSTGVFSHVNKYVEVDVSAIVFPEKTTRAEEETTEEETTQPTTHEKTTAEEPTSILPEITMNNPTEPTEITEVQTQVSSNGETYTVVTPDDDEWYLVLVNRYRRIAKGYVPELSYILESEGYSARLDYRVAPHYEDMYYAAKADGIILRPYSAYRSYERQETNYNNRIALWRSKGYSYASAVDRTAEVILPPGSSEHNLGLAIDINGTSDDFDLTPAYRWLTENAHKYGFILRYTSDKREITGIVDEPWHWRYVGVETATAMKGTGLCLEEYLANAAVES